MKRMRRLASRSRPLRPAQGAVLLAFLLAIALAGLASMAAVDVWSLTRQREREQQLLFVGDQYRAAIRDYYYGGPAGAGRALPTRLEMLLDDDRFPVPVHHLRRLYPDPITESADWGMLMVGDRIMGVYSKSEAQPVKQAGFTPIDATFAEKTAYRDWVFAFVPGRRQPLAPTSAVPGRPAPPATDPHRPTSREPT